jgi:hypothetical protein
VPGQPPGCLFEVCDAVLCRQDRVHMLAELSLEPECRRGHGAVYDALNCGEVRIGRLRRALAVLPLPPWDNGRIHLGVDVSNWLRPDGRTTTANWPSSRATCAREPSGSGLIQRARARGR